MNDETGKEFSVNYFLPFAKPHDETFPLECVQVNPGKTQQNCNIVLLLFADFKFIRKPGSLIFAQYFSLSFAVADRPIPRFGIPSVGRHFHSKLIANLATPISMVGRSPSNQSRRTYNRSRRLTATNN